MGREIRRVPEGWEHPKIDRVFYRPLYDKDFETAAREWLDNCIAWDNGTHKDAETYKEECPFFWQWYGDPPDHEYYRPKFENADCFQIYETVSEGTPISPVFKSKAEMLAWLIGQGYSENAASQFIEYEYAFSMVVCIKSDIHMYDE